MGGDGGKGEGLKGVHKPHRALTRIEATPIPLPWSLLEPAGAFGDCPRITQMDANQKREKKRKKKKRKDLKGFGTLSFALIRVNRCDSRAIYASFDRPPGAFPHPFKSITPPAPTPPFPATAGAPPGMGSCPPARALHPTHPPASGPQQAVSTQQRLLL